MQKFRGLIYGIFSVLLNIIAFFITRLLQCRVPDAGLTTEEYVKKYGYHFEKHSVATKDGYILTAHRILPDSGDVLSKRPPVLLMPALWRSSEVWLNLGPKRSLGFILADSGFDVWLLNNRGSTWSRKHTVLDPDQDAKRFWNFSLDEMGYYDCTAFIDYILKITSQESLIYIGDTQGAAMFFIMAAEQETYANKVKLMIAIAPTVDVGKAKTWAYTIFGINQNILQMFAGWFGKYEILPHSRWITLFAGFLCSMKIIDCACESIHFLGVGSNPAQFEKKTLPLLFNGFPAGASLKSLIHVAQTYKSGKFSKYDYGAKENYQIYGQLKPPVYEIRKIKTPVALLYGENDAFVDTKGAERFAAILDNLVYKKLVKGFNNGDFLWGIDVVELVYKDMIQLMKSYENI